MLASLAMYDAPGLRAASNAFYQVWREHMRAAGLAAPDELVWDRDLGELWRQPDLLVAQTCGYPFVKGECAGARLVATPCYEFYGCRGPYYRSILVASASRAGHDLASFAGQRAAVNSWDSYSGFQALRAHLARSHGEAAFFSSTLLTGSHAESLRALAEQRADLAAIDCVTWGHANVLEPELTEQLCEVGMTEPAPGLPLITSANRSEEELAALRNTLREALVDPRGQGARARLGLAGMQVLEDADYHYIKEQSQRGARADWIESL